jgi:hypothetical protein
VRLSVVAAVLKRNRLSILAGGILSPRSSSGFFQGRSGFGTGFVLRPLPRLLLDTHSLSLGLRPGAARCAHTGHSNSRSRVYRPGTMHGQRFLRVDGTDGQPYARPEACFRIDGGVGNCTCCCRGRSGRDTRQSNYWPIAAAISSGLTSRTGWPSDQ